MAARISRSTGTSGLAVCQAADSEPGVVAGVRWFGMKEGEAMVETGRNPVREPTRNTTLVLGSTHGPRLLELVGACAC